MDLDWRYTLSSHKMVEVKHRWDYLGSKQSGKRTMDICSEFYAKIKGLVEEKEMMKESKKEKPQE